jgi:integrase
MNPHNWHDRPCGCGKDDPCTVCGCPASGTGEDWTSHRATLKTEGISFPFIARAPHGEGWKYRGCFFAPSPTKTPAEPKIMLRNELWDIVLQRAGLAKTPKPRDTSPVRRAVVKYKAADQPNRSKSGDASSAKPSLDWTWPAFFRRYVGPCMKRQVRSGKRRKRGVQPYREAIGHWKRLTRNPTLGDTTRDDCDEFVRRLFRLPGRRGDKALFRWSARRRSWQRVRPPSSAGETERLLARSERDYRLMPRISPNTVQKLCNQMEMLFHWAGPPSKRLRDAADLMVGQDASGRPRRLPWLDVPPKVQGAERVFTREEIVRWLGACRHAKKPRIEGVTPEAWWRALLQFLYYTSLRIGTALEVRYSWISQEAGEYWLNVPGTSMKAQRPEPICLKPPAMAALESIRRPGRDLIFPWPWPPSGSHQPLYGECERLLTLAGIPPERRFRFHAIRACGADTLFAISPELARDALCHRDLRTTEQHYTQAKTRQARRAAAAAMPRLPDEGQNTLFDVQASGDALDAMPQPFGTTTP